MAAQGLTGGGAEAGNDVEDAFGQSRFHRELGEPQRRQWRLLGRFEHDGVTRRQSWRHLPHREIQREVPRRHGTDDTQRLTGHQGEIAGLGGSDLTDLFVDRLPVEREKICGRGHIDGMGLGDQFAHIHRVQECQLLAVVSDQLG